MISSYTRLDFRFGAATNCRPGDVVVVLAWGGPPYEGDDPGLQMLSFVSSGDPEQFACQHDGNSFPMENSSENPLVVLCASCNKRFEKGSRIICEADGRELLWKEAA
jgi:hypothetical protein